MSNQKSATAHHKGYDGVRKCLLDLKYHMDSYKVISHSIVPVYKAGRFGDILDGYVLTMVVEDL